VLAAADRVWVVNAATGILLFVSLVVFLTMHRPAASGAASPGAGAAGAQPAGYTESGSGGLPATITEPPPSSASTVRLGSSAASSPNTYPASALAADGIPSTALSAYQQAAQWEDAVDPACGITWPLLAAIGRVESDHGRFAGAVLHTDGTSTPPVIGIPLNGHGTALIRDTDGGRLDGDTVYDRAVGPMQFIPSTWAAYGVDANHDGRADPFNIFDAAAAAARYLCAASPLTTVAGQTRAVLAYNHSDAYVSLVLALERTYAAGVGLIVPVTSAPPTASPPPALPPVNPAPPPAASPPSGPSAPATSTPSSAPSPSSDAPTPPTSTASTPSQSDSSSGNPSDSSSASDTDSPTPTPDAPLTTDSGSSPGAPPAGASS
jgi:membrane-bound lytic murein transglycosylase B